MVSAAAEEAAAATRAAAAPVTVGEAGEVCEGEEGLSDKNGPELRVPGRGAAANRAVCAAVPTLILAALVSGPSMSLVKARLQ